MFEESTGFVNFTHYSATAVKRVDSGKTMVYLIAFDEDEISMNLELPNLGIFCGDDMNQNSANLQFRNNQEVLERLLSEEVNIKDFYFRKNRKFKIKSCILVGWSDYTYEYLYRVDPWCCTFKDLTNEGKKMYYSLKKLHNESEIRILTFNNIN